MTLEELQLIEEVLKWPDRHKGMVTYYQALEYIDREITLKTTNFVTGETESPNKPQNLKCPDCGGEMQPRTNRTTGQKFWGCKDYPQCKGTRDSDGLSKAERNKARDQEREEDNRERKSRRWSVPS